MSKTVGKSTYIYTTNECSAPQWSIFNISTKTVIWKRKLKYEIWHIFHFHLHCSAQSCSSCSNNTEHMEILFVSPRILEKDCYSLVWNSMFITLYLNIVTKIKQQATDISPTFSETLPELPHGECSPYSMTLPSHIHMNKIYASQRKYSYVPLPCPIASKALTYVAPQLIRKVRENSSEIAHSSARHWNRKGYVDREKHIEAIFSCMLSFINTK